MPKRYIIIPFVFAAGIATGIYIRSSYSGTAQPGLLSLMGLKEPDVEVLLGKPLQTGSANTGNGKDWIYGPMNIGFTSPDFKSERKVTQIIIYDVDPLYWQTQHKRIITEEQETNY